jgi:DNA-binding transcriptional LysR family regulator
MNLQNNVYSYNGSMDFWQIRAFVAVAEAGGFSRAAVQIASTQPTLSRQVRALEQTLGHPLFERFGRRVQLTAYGQETLTCARSLLAQAEALEGTGKARPRAVRGVLHLGASDSVVLGRLPALLRRFLRRHPGVRVQIRTASSPEILAWVRDGSCDLGLSMLPQAHPGLALRPLWEDRFVALTPPAHPMADHRATLADFSGGHLISIHPRTLSYQTLTATYQAAGLSLVPEMVFDSFSLLVAFIGAGLGVGISSAAVAEPALRRGQVARVRIPEIDRLPRHLGVALHAGRIPDGPLAAFLEDLES